MGNFWSLDGLDYWIIVKMTNISTSTKHFCKINVAQNIIIYEEEQVSYHELVDTCELLLMY